MTTNLLDELRAYVGFTEADAISIRDVREGLEPHYPEIVDRFYAAIEASPRARAVFEDGAQIERQKHLLRGWLDSLVSGPYDATYLSSRERIGHVHVRIGLDPSFMVTAMHVLRESIHDALGEVFRGRKVTESQRAATHRAFDRACDMDLAIMVETYRDDFALRIRANQRLAALGEIAGTIAHEIRNPLAVIRTSLHLALAHPEGEAPEERHLIRIREQIDHCSTLVTNLLDLARDSRPRRRPTPIVNVVVEALKSVRGGEGVELVLGVARDASANVDALQVHQLVTNLVSNALDVASAPSSVRITLTMTPSALELVVEDDGPGIPDEARGRLFEPLYTTRVQGTGLGLALCRRIAEGHGGSITAGPGAKGGACFTARLGLVETPS